MNALINLTHKVTEVFRYELNTRELGYDGIDRTSKVAIVFVDKKLNNVNIATGQMPERVIWILNEHIALKIKEIEEKFENEK